MRTQCKLLGISRSTLAYQPAAPPADEHRLKCLIDELYLRDPCLGSRRLITVLERDYGLVVNRKRLQRLRREMSLEAIYCRPRTSQPGDGHEIVPYLLRNLEVTASNEVWCTDITYVPMPRGNAYLCAVMDWYSRCVLGWAVSNTMDTNLCLSAWEMACDTSRQLPQIMNTDQGSQFTSAAWLSAVRHKQVRVSMDGKGRWMDNVFIERLWRSIKYEDIYLRQYVEVRELEEGVGRWVEHYNRWRPHQALDNRTPAQVHGLDPECTPPAMREQPKKAA
jgi:putative transposase